MEQFYIASDDRSLEDLISEIVFSNVVTFTQVYNANANNITVAEFKLN